MATRTSAQDSALHFRKRMRKGTRSCAECRRRKVRCLFKQNNAQACSECISRGSRCISQEYDYVEVEAKPICREPIDLNSLISQVLRRLDEDEGLSHNRESRLHATDALRNLRSEMLDSPRCDPNITPGDSMASSDNFTPGQTDESLNSAHQFENAPLLTLFENCILREGNHDSHSASKQPLSSETRHVIKNLRALAPSSTDLSFILQNSNTNIGWLQWRKTFPDLMESASRELDQPTDKEIRNACHYVVSSLISEDVAAVAKIMLCLTVSIHQLPAAFDITQTNLPGSLDSLSTSYMSFVETILEFKDGLACSLDGVECMTILAKIHVDMGRPRRAWLIIRQAVSNAQLLGCHRQHHGVTNKSSNRKRALWLQIWHEERSLSLLLGLPCATADPFPDIEKLQDDSLGASWGERLVMAVTMVMGRVIDRNSNAPNMSFSATVILDQDIEKCRNMMPQGWWESAPNLKLSVEATLDVLTPKFWYHNVRKLIHLPFMLKSSTDPRYEFSRIAALESSREMLGFYLILRDTLRPAAPLCEVVDFQVFTAAMVLVIDLLSCASSSTTSRQETVRQDTDWDTVYNVARELRRVSEEVNCSVASQGSRLLETFGKWRYPGSSDQAFQAEIPYFGSIRITRGSESTLQRTSHSLPTQFNISTHPVPTEAILEGVGFSTDTMVTFDSFLEPIAGSYDEIWRGLMDQDCMSISYPDLQDEWN